MSDWREQYDRMKRWRETIVGDRIDADRVQDIFLAFVQTCYHMVDWLELDPNLSQLIPKGEAEQYARGSDTLSLCGDLCIGAKHAVLERKLKRLDRGNVGGRCLQAPHDDGRNEPPGGHHREGPAWVAWLYDHRAGVRGPLHR
jgi:hypothetical protein